MHDSDAELTVINIRNCKCITVFKTVLFFFSENCKKKLLMTAAKDKGGQTTSRED